MTLNEFCTHLSAGDDRFRKSRLLVVPQRVERQQARAFYKQNLGVRFVRVSDSITTNMFVPMPDSVFFHLKECIGSANAEKKMGFVVGIDGYLALLDPDKKRDAYGILRAILEDENLHAVFLLSSLDLKNQGSPFAYPRFLDGQSIVFIGGGIAESAFPGEVIFTRREFKATGYVLESSIHDFLSTMEDETLDGEAVCVFVDSAYDALPGVDKDIQQLFTLKGYMKKFWAIGDDVSEEVAQWIYDVLRRGTHQGSALSDLQARFCPTGIQDLLITAPKKIRETYGAEREALVWMLKHTISKETYLHRVLSNEHLSLKAFVAFYVSIALDLVDHPQAERLSEERRKALKETGHENLVSAMKSFVSQSKDKPTRQVAAWLNNGTDIEKQELLRRVMTDQGLEIASSARESYPLLDAYLQDYKLGFDGLNDYFTNYRVQKLKNAVSAEFCQRALEEDLPADVPARDGIIQGYAADAKTALLVIDALGVEYVPMILELGQRRGTGVEDTLIGYSKLPTATCYNTIIWPAARRLQDVKQLDNISHHGAEAHAVTSVEENLLASIEAIEEYVLPAVEEGLLSYDRVVLTSDHGVSRLAVRAHEMGFSKTIDIPTGATVSDWRYATASKTVPCPESMTPSFCGKYWTVKGYNRLPKQGGKCYEVHGGSTLEERLVPVIVFVKGAVFSPKPQRSSFAGNGQIVEKDDFDL